MTYLGFGGLLVLILASESKALQAGGTLIDLQIFAYVILSCRGWNWYSVSLV